MQINLKEFREKALNLSQQGFADRLKVSQNTVSRWEEKPASLTIDQLTLIANTFGYELVDLVEISRTKTEPWKLAENSWIPIKKNVSSFREQLENTKQIKQNSSSYQDIKVFQKYVDEKINLLEGTEKVGRKPSVTFTGESDAGKSTMINTMIGDDTLPAKWTPTTSAGAKLVHINNKPEFMEENTTAVFKTKIKSSLIQTHMLYNKKYFNDHLVKMGSINLIEDFGTHKGKESEQKSEEYNYTIVSYLDAPILKVCEIWDVPGTGASSDEDLSDDYTASVAKQGADIVIYLSVSNQFMHNYDQQYLKEAIDILPPFDVQDDKIDPFENLFVVASQAHIVTENKADNGIKDLMHNRINEFGKTLPEGYWEELSKKKGLQGNNRYSLEDIQNRAFTFERDRSYLQKDFKEAFIKLLDKLMNMKKAQSNKYEEHFFPEYDKLIDSEIKKLDVYTANASEAIKDYNSFMAKKPEIEQRNRDMVNIIQNKAAHLKTDTRDKISDLYDEMITVDNVRDLIVKKDFGKKKEGKEKFVTWLQNDLNSKVEDIMTKNTNSFNEAINDKLEEYQSEDSEVEINTFNYAASFIGSLSTLATVGAFSVYFASLGNLGGYILVAKALSALSALGISVGGVSTAVTFISTIGGPMTLAIGIAIIVGASMTKLVGGSWQRTLAKQIVKEFNKEREGKNYKQNLIEQSDEYWENTHDAITFDLLNKNVVEREKELEQQALQKPEEFIASKEALQTLKFSNYYNN